jgi:enamine deaminase RidA (YjgF/YER057c/UK114 family)
MKKKYVSPPDHWTWPFPVSHSQAVRLGDMIWVSGQVGLPPDGGSPPPSELAAQVAAAVANLRRILSSLECGLADVVKMLCFYVNDGSLDEEYVLRLVAAELPPDARPAVTAVPVSYLPFEGTLVEIEAYAMPASLPRQLLSKGGFSPLPETFPTGLRCGKMIFISGQSPVTQEGRLLEPGDIVAQTRQVMRQAGEALAHFGAGFADVVKVNRWYVGQGRTEDFEPAALACAAHFQEPGPAATGIPIPRHARAGQQIKIEVVAMLGEDGSHLPRRNVWPDSLWDWTVDIPYWHGLKCHDMIFLGGQVSLDTKGLAVNPFDMRAQTAQAMVHIGSILRELGAGYADICKLTTMYAGPAGMTALAENMGIRQAFFDVPGPATTDISLPVLAYPGMIIEIDAFAMSEPD